MSKRKTIKVTFDDKLVFRLELQGSDEIVDKLLSDIFFNSMLRDAVKELVEARVKSKKENL